MQNSRKVLAIVLAMLMICTMLPMSALVSAATVIASYDFEDGNASWGGTIIDDNGGKAIQWDANGYGYLNKKPTLTANTFYKVTFDTKGAEVNGLIWDGTKAIAIKRVPASTDWHTESYVFNSGNNTSLNFRFQNPSSSAKTIYLDNIKLETLDGSVDYDGYLYDGNMEANSGNWVDLNGSSKIVSDPTGAGRGNVLQTNATAAGDMFRQQFYMDTETDYVLSFKVYSYYTTATNNVFWVKFNTNVTYDFANIQHDGLAGVVEYNTTTVRCNVNGNNGKWINVSIPFSSNSATTTPITIYNYRNIGQYYFDDFKVVKAGEEPVEPDTPDAPAGNETPSNDGYIINGDFETGDANAWTAGAGATIDYSQKYAGNFSMHMTANSGSYAYGLSQTVAVEKNTNYTVSFYYTLVDGVNIRLYICDGDKSATNIKPANGGSQPVAYGNSSSAVNGVWKQATISFNSGENESIFLKVGGGSSGYGECYLDNFVMTKDANQPETPAVDSLIVNGDFETGSKDPWTSGSSSAAITINSTNKHGGSYGAMIPARNRTFTAKQAVTVKANTNYTVTFWYKSTDAAQEIHLLFGVYAASATASNNDALAAQVALDNTKSDWTKVTYVFNSGDNTSVLVAFGSDNSSCLVKDYIYVDDIVMVEGGELPSEPAGYVGSYPETMTSGADIRFMTYNVLVGQDTENGGYSWGSAIDGRPEKAFAMINYYKPDVIALEEFSGEWYDAFTAQMTNYALGEMTSADSQNNGKLYTCLAYNTETIRLIETKLFRNTVSHWGTQGMRYVNVAVFEVIATGERFIAAALHPDAGNLVGDQDLNGDGVAEEGDGYWRQFQLQEDGEYLAALSEEYQLPVIVGGDFNSGLDGTYDDNTSWYNFTDAGFTDATAGRYIDHIMYNGMATHLYETTVADAAVNGASDHKAVFADIQFLDEFATPIKTAKDYIKTQGRTQLKDGAMWLDFSASGIEFSANCEGTVALNLTVNSIKNTDATYGGLYFTVIVDGVKKDRAECRITETGNVQLVLAEDLPAGNHTFEVYRQTEHRGAEVGISSIVMNGSFNEKPDDNRLYIEFIGDSISTGYGALGVSGDDQADSPLWQDATAAYPYLTAKALNADFSDVAWSGLGCKYGYQSLTMQTVYTAQRYQYDQTTQYDFTKRQPDVVVIALGTNDIANQTDASLRKVGYQEMLDLVRAKNPDAKIVWIAGMMKTDDNAMIEALIEENGGAAEGLYYLGLTTNTAGAGWHPSAAGQQVFADELVAFLNSDVLVKYVGDEMLDNDEGDIIDYVGSSRMEMTSGKLGLAFGFGLNIEGLEVVNGNCADLTNATVDAFGDGTQYKLLAMGAIVTNDAVVGLSDLKLDDVDGKKTIDVNAERLYDLEGTYAQFAVRITNIPLANEDTVIYARAYFVIEYEGREVVVYDDIQSANYINKYDSNDGVLEW